ncbi:PC4/YdbC family ssDNA-binding protein [Thomasclavelia ramosa]|uniref:PC4/YdbC family ssDNA-binding protein n=1 Tax=Thomasclavelia ramosa TaxID=1547 RepID=UPI00300DD058
MSKHNNITKELNIIAFGNGEPVYDLRKWDRSKDRMLKGISFTKDELVELKQVLENMNL